MLGTMAEHAPMSHAIEIDATLAHQETPRDMTEKSFSCHFLTTSSSLHLHTALFLYRVETPHKYILFLKLVFTYKCTE